MTARDRLRDSLTQGPWPAILQQSDARKLDALVEACIEEQRLMEIAGNVKPGIDAEAAWEAYDEAARATQAALRALTTEES
jgi:hypothetical protein